MNNDKEKLSQQLKVDEDMEVMLLKQKKRYESMSLAALVAEMNRKTAETDRCMDVADSECDSVDSEDLDVEKEYSDDKADWEDEWESGIDQKER